MSDGSIVIGVDLDTASLNKGLGNIGTSTKVALNGVSKHSEEIDKIWNSLNETSQKYKDSVEQLQSTFDDMTGSAKKAGDALERISDIDIETPLRSAEESTSRLQKGMSAFGSTAKTVISGIAKAATAVTAAWGAISVLGVNYNSTIEQLQASFETMTGSAEKAASVVERLKTMGAKTPFETVDLGRTTQLLMQYGFTADQAIDRMQLLGDIAQGNAEKMMSVATGYAQMSSAGKVNLQDIKQMINICHAA